LALTIAGILAVIMIIIAGVQWVTSGGNSEMINGAKKRIGGALTGLLIAYLSYTILNTINPALTNLRLPQNFLIRPSNLVTTNFCVDLEKLWKVAPVAAKTDTPKESDWIEPFKELDVAKICENETSMSKSLNPTREDMTKCGQMYLVQDGGGATCMGSICEPGTACDNNKCVTLGAGQNGGIAGKIKWREGQYTEGIRLFAACSGDGDKFSELEKINSNESYVDYSFSPETIQKAVDACGSEDAVDGFFFGLEINDPVHALGVTSWNDVWYGGTSLCENVSNAPSCGFVGTNHWSDNMATLATDSLGRNGQLIPFINAKKGFVCNFNLGSATVMPIIGADISEAMLTGVSTKLQDSFPNIKGQIKTALSSSISYFSGISGFSCPAYDRSNGMFEAKLKKLRCKCNPAKCQ